MWYRVIVILWCFGFGVGCRVFSFIGFALREAVCEFLVMVVSYFVWDGFLGRSCTWYFVYSLRYSLVRFGL